jgi:hypothetical protein
MEQEPTLRKIAQTGIDILGYAGHSGRGDQLGLIDERNQHRARDQPATKLPSKVTGQGRTFIRFVQRMAKDRPKRLV